MTNQQLVEEYIKGEKRVAVANHSFYSGQTFVNYSTTLCEIDREHKKARLNARKYSSTTSKIQGILRYELTANGYEVEEYQGESCTYWNYGFVGAEKLKMSDTL